MNERVRQNYDRIFNNFNEAKEFNLLKRKTITSLDEMTVVLITKKTYLQDKNAFFQEILILFDIILFEINDCYKALKAKKYYSAYI